MYYRKSQRTKTVQWGEKWMKGEREWGLIKHGSGQRGAKNMSTIDRVTEKWDENR